MLRVSWTIFSCSWFLFHLLMESSFILAVFYPSRILPFPDFILSQILPFLGFHSSQILPFPDFILPGFYPSRILPFLGFYSSRILSFPDFILPRFYPSRILSLPHSSAALVIGNWRYSPNQDCKGCPEYSNVHRWGVLQR